MMVASFATHPAISHGCRRLAAILSPVSRHRPSSQLRSNNLWMGKCRLKMKLPAVFDLGDRVEARQVEPSALLGPWKGELGRAPGSASNRSSRWRMISGAQAIGGGLQRGYIIHREKGVVDLAKADPRSVQFLLDEAVAIEVIRGLERQEQRRPASPSGRGFRRGCRNSSG